VDQGLFDLKYFAQMMVIEGAGLGGGSLIYANMHLRAPKEVFDAGWPSDYSRTALDKYYDLVAYMLDIRPITESKHFTTLFAASGGLLPRTALMQKAATNMGFGAEFCYPNIAVDFGPPGVPQPNKFGAMQAGCTYCGECDIGWEVHAKNNLDLGAVQYPIDHAGSDGLSTKIRWSDFRTCPLLDEGVENCHRLERPPIHYLPAVPRHRSLAIPQSSSRQ
jgi:GMC oxidoreductase